MKSRYAWPNTERHLPRDVSSGSLPWALGLRGGETGALVLDLIAENGKTIAQSDSFQRVPLTLTHEEIAQMIGSSRETVTRLFTDFKRKHLVEIHGSTLIITNKAGLEKVLEV